MEKVALPSGLQSLTFGWKFNQSTEKVALLSGLQGLTFGDYFNQSMAKVALPSGLQSLTFGVCLRWLGCCVWILWLWAVPHPGAG
jgi:hypothetical protein